MLKEDQGVRYLIPLAQRNQLSLQLPPFRVRRQAREPANIEARLLVRALLEFHVEN